MLSGFKFPIEKEIYALTIFKDIIIVGGNFKYIHIFTNGSVREKKVNSNVLSLTNDNINNIYVGFEDGNILILNSNFKKINLFFTNQDKIDCLLFVNKFNLLFSGCKENKGIQVWNKEGKYITTLAEEYGSYPAILNYSLTFPYLYSAHKNNGITVWNIETKKYNNYIETNNKVVNMVSYKDNLILGELDGFIRIKNERNFITKFSFEIKFNIYSLNVFNDNIIVGTNGILKFYDFKGKHEKDKIIHDTNIHILQIKNNKIYTSSKDNSYKIIEKV